MHAYPLNQTIRRKMKTKKNSLFFLGILLGMTGINIPTYAKNGIYLTLEGGYAEQ